MKIVIVADHHYYRVSDGTVFVPSVYGYEYWKRYLNVFENIVIVCRGENNPTISTEGMLVASGPNVSFMFIKDFRGVKNLIIYYLIIQKRIAQCLNGADGVIIRVPSPLSKFAIDYCSKNKVKMFCEVAADPSNNYDGLPFSSVIKSAMKKSCQKACLNANGVAYVTKNQLQEKYPSRASLYGETIDFFESYYSDANLDISFFSCRKDYTDISLNTDISIIHVSNVISGEGKGHYVCLEVVERLLQNNIKAKLIFIGDGPDVKKIRLKAEKMGISGSIEFAGRISAVDELRAQYLKSDFMILPSKTEGVPRSIIEAMACGIVCIASNVGGIPELLDNEYLFDWEDSKGYAEKIYSLLRNPSIMEEISQRNQNKARNYSEQRLQERRDAFYGKVKVLCQKNSNNWH